MLARRFAWWSLFISLTLPFACQPERHEFSSDSAGAAGLAGSSAGGSANAGRGSLGGNGHTSGNGPSTDGGESGDNGSGGDAGSAAEGGAGPIAGSGPSAGAGQTAGAGSNAGTGGLSSGGSSGNGAAGSGGNAAGAGGAVTAGTAGSVAGSGGAPAAPTILDTAPADHASGVRSDQNIVVVFSQAMDRGATEAAFDKQSLPAGSFSWSADSKTMTYKPSTPLAYATATAPATPQARLYSFQIRESATSAAGVRLAAAQTFFFTTARQIILELFPSELWSVKSTGTASQCMAPAGCTKVPIGDDDAKVGLRAVFRYTASLPAEAFVQEVQMYVDIGFVSGSVSNLGALQVAKVSTVAGTPTPTGATFTFSPGANGTTTSANVTVPALISNGSLGTADLLIAVQWSIVTDNDNAPDNISLGDGHLVLHYLLP